MKSTYDGAISLVGGIGLAMAVGSAFANPKGGVVVAGTATITAPNASVLNISQATSKAAIDWRSFSIANGEQVNFLQPSTTASTLNRVLDGQASVIDGALNANGQVYLLNSSGILFGRHANVNVNGLVATTSNLGTGDFMAGRLNFARSAQTGAVVQNEGTISARDGGFAALVAPTVRNSGVISARVGRIALGAGDAFTVDLYGDQLINFAVPTGSPPIRTVTQSGSLIADGGRVLLSTDAVAGIVHGVVNMSGTVQADSAAQLPSGAIVLSGSNTDVVVSGSLTAVGGTPGSVGGSIDLLGSAVDLSSTARVDASGSGGGGTVRIGGGFQNEAATRIADSVTVQPGAAVDVSAIKDGNAGRVAVWGKSAVGMAGDISARGGSLAGNGGRIEISGANSVSLTGHILANAPVGQGGTLLLDPANITIQPIGSNNLTDPTIAGATIRGLLRQGVSVQLLASNTITVNDLVDGRPLAGQNQSTVSGAFALQAGTILLLQPIITNNSPVSLVSTSGDITFQANSYVVVVNTGSSLGVGNADVTITSAHNVTANQIISLGRVSVTAAGDVHMLQALNGLQNVSGATGIGELDVNAQGSVSMSGVESIGNVNINGATGVSLGGPVYASGSLAFAAASSAAAITLAATSATNIAGAAAGGDIAFTTPGAVTLNSSVLSHGGNISIGSSTQSAGAVAMAAGTALQSVDSSGSAMQGGGISIYTSADLTAQDLIAGSSGSVVLKSLGAVTLNKGLFGLAGISNVPIGVGALTIDATGDVATQGAKVSGAINVSSGGALQNSVSSLISAGGPINLNAKAITLAAISNAGGTTAALDSGGDATLTASNGAVTLNSGVLAKGAVTINATGDVTTTGVQAANALSVTSGATLQNSTLSFTSTNGPISLTANALNVAAIPAAGNTPVAALDSGGDIVLVSTGTATLGGSVLAKGGKLDITAGGNVVTNGAKASKAIDISTTSGSIQNTATGFEAGTDVVLTTPGAVVLNTPVMTHGGNIQIGSQAHPVSSLILTGALQSVESATAAQTGGIAIFTVGDLTAQNLLAGSHGTVVLSSQGRVTLNDSLFGLSKDGTAAGPPAGIGALTINALGDVTTLGAQVDGAIQVTSGGTLQNSTATLTSANGSINLSAANITLNQLAADAITGVPKETLNAAGDIVLATPGAAVVNGEIESLSGNVQIGTDAHPVGSLTTSLVTNGTPNDILLKSGATAGRIDVRASGPITTSSLVTGTAGVVDVRGTDVTVAGAINDATGTLGVGDVSITGNGTNGVVVNGILVSGNAHDLNGNSLALNTGTLGGSVAIRGAIVSGGPVFIGQTGPYVPDADPHTTTPGNAQINLSNNITTSGQSVTINGDVTLFKGITRWDIECAVTGVCLAQHNAVDPLLFSAGVGREFLLNSVVGTTGGAALQYVGLSNACSPATRCPLSFVNTTFQTNGATTVQTDVRISCSSSNCLAAAGDTTINCAASCSQTTIVTTTISGVQSGPPSITIATLTGTQDVTGFAAGVFFPVDQGLTLAKLTALAVDAQGNPLAKYNTVTGGSPADASSGGPGPSSPPCNGDFVCGIHQSDFVSTDPAVLALAETIAAARIAAMNRLFGALTAKIDTTSNSHPLGADVTISGNVARYRGANVPSPYSLSNQYYTPALGYIAPTYVSHALDIAAGTGSTIAIRGNLGDDESQTGLATVTVMSGGGGSAGIDVGLSGLGTFSLSFSANSVQLANQPTVYAPLPRVPGYYVTGLTLNSNTSCITSGPGVCSATAASPIANLGFAYDYLVTTPASGTFTSPTTSPTPNGGIGSSASGGNGSGAVPTTVVSNGTGVTGTASGSGSNSVTGFGGGEGLAGLPFAAETSTSLPSTVESIQNSSELEATTNNAWNPQLLGANDPCPRGAAQLADLGSRSTYGSPPNVFARCRKN